MVASVNEGKIKIAPDWAWQFLIQANRHFK